LVAGACRGRPLPRPLSASGACGEGRIRSRIGRCGARETPRRGSGRASPAAGARRGSPLSPALSPASQGKGRIRSCSGRCGARAGEAPNRTTRQRPVSGLSALPAAGSPAQRSGDATRHRDAIGSGRAQFRSPPPLRSGGRGPGGGGSQGMHRHPVEPRPTFPPLPAQFAGGGAHPRHSPTPCRTPIEGLLSPALFAGERPGEGPLAATVCRLLHGT
jgi:hypothetical protein